MAQPPRRPHTRLSLHVLLHHTRQHWHAWRQRRRARKALRRLDNNQLEDIGLTRRDVDNFW
ncbi:DUF1127 domain-containing protein [Dickeya oryzae]|uniref:DUF1127 domain-containing protein n=1 Tax=Dickeya oryzae TaxID=1240404 RepID=UPI001295D5B8